ncbi:MAG: hypothetical protein ACYC7A_00445 [Thermoanaerobaculia bacterium]
MRSRLIVAGILCTLFTISVWAQESHVRVLVPVAIGEIPGAYDSVWTSKLWVRNQGATEAYFFANEPCPTLCPTPLLAAGESREVHFRPQPAGNPGFVMSVGSDAKLAFNLRVQDLSRQALTWGTEIPLVREQSFTSKPISLLNVPLDKLFRQMLRIYALEQEPGIVARVRVLRAHVTEGEADTELASIDLPLDYSGDPVQLPYVQFGYIVQRFPALIAHDTVTVEVTPMNPNVRLWSFLSITNNLTQHVTLITPQ